MSISKFAIAIMLFVFLSNSITRAQTKKKSYRKVQEVNFNEMSLKGTVRNPEGAFLVQKKGLKFMPLYEVQKNLDQKIRESAHYVE